MSGIQSDSASAVAGYSGKPLSAKLGYKAVMRVRLIGMPLEVRHLLGDILPELQPVELVDADVFHVFTTSRSELRALVANVTSAFNVTEVLWVSWRKKSRGVSTDITEDRHREWILPTGVGGCQRLRGGCDVVSIEICVA